MHAGNEASRSSESRKRRRLSERRRVFGRMGASQWAGDRRRQVEGGGSLSTPDQSSVGSSIGAAQPMEVVTVGSRSDSPSLMADSSSIAVKIQFHITVAPENEPLVVLEPSLTLEATPRRKGSVGDQIQERLLQRSSTRRRHQLLALHKQPAVAGEGGPDEEQQQQQQRAQEEEEEPPAGHQRSSTISGGLGADEATRRFLERHRQQPQQQPPPPRELIYFKRDGQRFGHEFTLKLATERTYRCLLKLRPLMPLASITVQGQQVLFADCSASSASSRCSPPPPAQPHSAPASSSALNGSWQDVRPRCATEHHLGRAMTSHELRQAATRTHRNSSFHHLKSQQQQLLRHFHHLTASSASSSHLGSQLIYMFDWSAARFEPNKNKNRTQLQTVLRFKNGQVLALPLQVKFYQSECRQHLSWGSQLHFIDYDCQLDQLGQISLHRVQYY